MNLCVRSSMFAGILLSICLYCGNCPCFAVEPETSYSVSSTTREDLLIFFEESELVTATKRSTTLRKAPAIATVVTAEDIRNMGARSLMDVLKTIPSMGISIDEFGRSLLEVRGVRTLTSEKILFMIDGHKLNEAWTGSAIANVYNDLPVENIKRLEVIKGPGSALYGSNAFVAVINIVTWDAIDLEGFEAKGTGGAFGTRKAVLTAGKTIGDLSLSGSGGYQAADGPRLQVGRDSLSGKPPLVSGAPGDTNQRLEWGDLFMKASYGDFSVMGQYVNKSRGANVGLNFALTPLDDLRYENFWTEVSHKRDISSDLSIKGRVYLDQFTLDSKLGILPPGNPGFAGGMSATTQLVDRNIGIELQLDYDLFKGNHIIAGGQFENIEQFDVRFLANFNPLTNAPLNSFRDVSSIANFNKNAGRDIYAIYLQDEWEIIPTLNLTSGVRYDNYSDFGDTLNPRFGLVWEFLKNAELKLLYGQAFRAPNFKELYDQNNSFSIGNPLLKPEKIHTYEAGIGYVFSRFAKININYFLNQIDDMIDRDTTQTPTRYINKGKAEIHGVESEIGLALPSMTHLRIGYIHQDARNTIEHRPLDWVPADRLTTSVNKRINKYLDARIDLFWTGNRPRPPSDTRPESPSYTTVDLTLTAKKIIKNLEISGSVKNLFDERYSDPDTSGSLKRIPGDLPREGISGYISAAYKF